MAEFEIKNFIGIQSSNVLPPPNACTLCDNLDVRGTKGALVTRTGYYKKYDPPGTFDGILSGQTNLSFCNFYIPDIGGGREVTFLIQKATVNRITGSGVSPTTKNILAFFIRPYWGNVKSGAITSATTIQITTDIQTTSSTQYVDCLMRVATGPASASTYFRKIISHTNGANAVFNVEAFPIIPSGGVAIYGWTDSWEWLNKIYLTKIQNIPLNPGGGGPYQSNFEIYKQDSLDDNYYRGWTIYNLTKNEYDIVLASTYNGTYVELLTAKNTNTWANSNVIYLMQNYLPLDYLENMYNSISASDIAFHKVLNDLRIGFGGKEYRLGISVGYRSKVLDLGNYPPSNPGSGAVTYLEGTWLSNVINQIIITPYNCFGLGIDVDVTMGSSAGSFSAKKYYYYVTAMLDDYEEIVIASGNFSTSTNDDVTFDVKFTCGLLNNRITSVKVYLSENTSGATTDSEPYYFIEEKALFVNEILIGAISMLNDGIYYLQFHWTYLPAFTKEILDELGYSPTTNYALSWDQAVVTKGKTYMINPYFADGGRILNNIFYSPISGDGERQYDVITPGKFIPGESFDANDLIGLQLLPNMDFLGIRRNGVQWIDSENGVSKQILYGNGAVGNRAIVNFGEYIIFPGENDIIMANPLRAEDISDGTIRETYRAITTKTNIIATREEKDNAYRMFTGDTTSKQEYLLTKKGWIGAKRNTYPVAYTIAKDGTVWFLGSDGKIYYDTAGYGDNVTPISYYWRSIDFDLSKIGENIKGDMRFYLQMLWFRYECKTAFTVTLYLDGKGDTYNIYDATVTYPADYLVIYNNTVWKSLQNSNINHTPSEGAWWTANYYQRFTVNANYKYFTMPVIPGASCRTFQIDIAGSDSEGGTTKIYSLGIEFRPIPIGIYAKIP